MKYKFVHAWYGKISLPLLHFYFNVIYTHSPYNATYPEIVMTHPGQLWRIQRQSSHDKDNPCPTVSLGIGLGPISVRFRYRISRPYSEEHLSEIFLLGSKEKKLQTIPQYFYNKNPNNGETAIARCPKCFVNDKSALILMLCHLFPDAHIRQNASDWRNWPADANAPQDKVQGGKLIRLYINILEEI